MIPINGKKNPCLPCRTDTHLLVGAGVPAEGIDPEAGVKEGEEVGQEVGQEAGQEAGQEVGREGEGRSHKMTIGRIDLEVLHAIFISIRRRKKGQRKRKRRRETGRGSKT